jgi:hypothetical protein
VRGDDVAHRLRRQAADLGYLTLGQRGELPGVDDERAVVADDEERVRIDDAALVVDRDERVDALRELHGVVVGERPARRAGGGRRRLRLRRSAASRADNRERHDEEAGGTHADDRSSNVDGDP